MKIGDKIQFVKDMRNDWGVVVFQQGEIVKITQLMADDRYIFPDATYIKL